MELTSVTSALPKTRATVAAPAGDTAAVFAAVLEALAPAGAALATPTPEAAEAGAANAEDTAALVDPQAETPEPTDAATPWAAGLPIYPDPAWTSPQACRDDDPALPADGPGGGPEGLKADRADGTALAASWPRQAFAAHETISALPEAESLGHPAPAFVASTPRTVQAARLDDSHDAGLAAPAGDVPLRSPLAPARVSSASPGAPAEHNAVPAAPAPTTAATDEASARTAAHALAQRGSETAEAAAAQADDHGPSLPASAAPPGTSPDDGHLRASARSDRGDEGPAYTTAARDAAPARGQRDRAARADPGLTLDAPQAATDMQARPGPAAPVSGPASEPRGPEAVPPTRFDASEQFPRHPAGEQASAEPTDLPSTNRPLTAPALAPDTGAGMATAAPVAAADPLAASVPPRHEPHRQIADAIVRTRDGMVEILLDPVELGRVTVVLGSSDRMSLGVTAERPETLDLIRRHSDQLLRDLRDNGMPDARLDFMRQDTRIDPRTDWRSDARTDWRSEWTGGPGHDARNDGRNDGQRSRPTVHGALRGAAEDPVAAPALAARRGSPDATARLDIRL